jgi:hypothetical protein
MNGAGGEPDHLSRSDAIRTLLWMGLAAAYEERKRPISGDSDDHHAGDARREKLLASVCCLATIRSFAHSLSLPAISCTS